MIYVCFENYKLFIIATCSLHEESPNFGCSNNIHSELIWKKSREKATICIKDFLILCKTSHAIYDITKTYEYIESCNLYNLLNYGILHNLYPIQSIDYETQARVILRQGVFWPLREKKYNSNSIFYVKLSLPHYNISYIYDN